MSEHINKLNKVDPADINDVLVKIQRSFNIKLDNEGLKDVSTFGNLCDVIISKINLECPGSCTTQHAFYMLRNALAATTKVDKSTIKPQTRLLKFFPRENRQDLISKIESELGFKINLLQPRRWIIGMFISLLAGSIIGCFYNWQIGAAGLIASVIGLKIAGKFGKEMHLKTVGDLANKISRESFLKYRRNADMINKTEIEQKVKEFFIKDLHVEPIMLTRQLPF